MLVLSTSVWDNTRPGKSPILILLDDVGQQRGKFSFETVRLSSGQSLRDLVVKLSSSMGKTFTELT
jgi:hypothetical protein